MTFDRTRRPRQAPARTTLSQTTTEKASLSAGAISNGSSRGERRLVLRHLVHVGAGLYLAPLLACSSRAEGAAPTPASVSTAVRRFKVEKSDDAWRQRLSPQQYEVLRHKGTERAFTGATWNEKRAGVYRCAGCQTPLFSSSAKFDSGTGWPSFTAPLTPSAVLEERDQSHGMVRTEVLCASCGGHLGHVFDDGPRPTGLRYCMNSAAMHFEPAETRSP